MKGEIPLILDSITPRAGPTYGTTNVLVRAKRIGQYVLAYEKPKCKFGTNDKIVDASLVMTDFTDEIIMSPEGDDINSISWCTDRRGFILNFKSDITLY